ncbi:MAG: hypothetical protein AAGF94_07110 [Pseudomonadota bacterium]
MVNRTGPILAVCACAVLLGCTQQPSVSTGGSISENGGTSAAVGVNAGRTHAGVGTGGAYAGVDVVQADRVSAGVGTGGAYASADVVEAGPADVDVGVSAGGPSASVGLGRVRVGYGLGGWRLGF